MERIPEPELMNDPVQAEAYAHADFEEPHQAFIDQLRARLPAIEPRRVLDLGSGPADITIRFALAYPECEILGIDGAKAMLDLGMEAVKRARLAMRIRFLCACLPDIAFAARFDMIISNSLLHHLADPMVLWDTVKRAAEPGAYVFVMDLMRPDTPERAGRLVERYAADEPGILKRDFFNSLLAAYRPAEVAAQIERAGLAFTIEIMSDRHLAAFGRCA